LGKGLQQCGYLLRRKHPVLLGRLRPTRPAGLVPWVGCVAGEDAAPPCPFPYARQQGDVLIPCLAGQPLRSTGAGQGPKVVLPVLAGLLCINVLKAGRAVAVTREGYQIPHGGSHVPNRRRGQRLELSPAVRGPLFKVAF